MCERTAERGPADPDVLYQGILRSAASWARVGRGYLAAFLRLGIDVRSVASRGFGHDPGVPLPSELRVVTPRAARAGPQPALGLGFGRAILEGTAAGRPVITTGWGGQTEYVPPGEDSLPYRLEEAHDVLYERARGARVAHPDVEALAARMRWHFEHPSASRELGANAPRRSRAPDVGARRASPPRGRERVTDSERETERETEPEEVGGTGSDAEDRRSEICPHPGRSLSPFLPVAPPFARLAMLRVSFSGNPCRLLRFVSSVLLP